MKIGVLSDTHDHLEKVAAAVRLFNARGVELVLHLGDWVAPFVPVFMTRTGPETLRCPLKGIFGNNDGDHMMFLQVAARERTGVEIRKSVFSLDAGGRKLICYHGTEPEITEALIACGQYDAVFAGHTHGAAVRRAGAVLHINPGTVCGIHGGKPGGPCTVAIYDTDTHDGEIVEV